MKRLIVCADGTWNSDDVPEGKRTNVFKLAHAVAEAAGPVRQLVCYQDGVGSGPSRMDRLLGGAFGKGLSENILACYRFLVDNFEPGDELYLFGFSRGAYTARSIGGLIRNSGIVRREHRARIAEAYALYRDRADDAHPSAQRARAFRAAYAQETSIKCVGVWDTVGSLGIPTDGPLGKALRDKYAFHDVTLSSRVENAFHALAIDERRKPFAPTLWAVDTPEGQQRVEQVWFAGAHSNVGGGCPDTGLSDQALRWMMERAAECGLGLKPGAIEAACPAYTGRGRLYDSLSKPYKALGEHRRQIGTPVRHPKTGALLRTCERVHESVERRLSLRPPDVEAAYGPEPLLHYLTTMQRTAAPPPAAPRDAAKPRHV